MREERVTKNLLAWLQSNGWKIICYDFPQSGTGVLLHPNTDENRTTKNKGGIIPDILATRNSVALFFENKDRYLLSDFEKIKEIKTLSNYSNSLNKILSNFNVTSVYYGIGIPAIEKHINKSLEDINGIDFLISTLENGEVQINFDEYGILP
jgi:DNA integrity scanning protein DisA with diadenylate cyclase activity